MKLHLLPQGILLSGFLFLFLAWGLSRPAFFRRCVGESTAGSLGAIRMLVCSILLVSACWEDLGSSALLPREMLHPSGVNHLLQLLPIGFESFLSNRAALILFQRVTLLLLFFGAIGWKSRWTVPAGGLCYLIMAGIFRSYAWFYHTGLVPLYVIGVLSFTPCGDGWSLDRLGALSRGREVPPRSPKVYGWARYACWAAVALPYMAAGMSKVRNVGWMWWNPDNMRNILYRDTLNPMQFEWTWSLLLPVGWNLPFALLGLSALFGELSFGLVLVSRWARRILPAVMAGMHLGILFLQNVLFFDLILLQPIFYDFGPVRRKVGASIRSKGGGLEVLYDGFCPLCRRTIKFLRSLDLFEQVRFGDFRAGALQETNRRHSLKLTSAELEEQMFVIRKGRPLAGFAGYRALAGVLPLFWPLFPLMFLPGVPWIGQGIYQRVARQRLAGTRCGLKGCPGSAGSDVAPAPVRREGIWPLGISALAAFLIFCWYVKVEQFPFTAMQMYTKSYARTVTYYRVKAQLESGEWVRAYPEKVIGAMSDGRYRRCIRQAFASEKERKVCELFLQACGKEHNRTAPPGRRWTALEVQKWIWDYEAAPSDREHGQFSDRVTVPLQISGP